MSFADLLVQRLVLTFLGGDRVLLGRAGALLAFAHQRGVFQIEALTDTSALLVFLACQEDHPFRELVAQDQTRRGFHLAQNQDAVGRSLEGCLPLAYHDLLLVGRAQGQTLNQQRSLLVRLILYHWGPTLQRFLSRFLLRDSSDPALHERVMRVLVQAIAAFWSDPATAVEFPCHLYRQALRQFQRVDSIIPAAWPTLPPIWEVPLTLGERSLLTCSLNLETQHRCLVLLSFYARLNVPQIACVLQEGHGDATTQTVGQHTQWAWQRVLSQMT